MTVYVVQSPERRAPDGRVEVTMDLTPAAQFGELVYLLDDPRQILAPVPAVRDIRAKMRGFSEDDYILPVGSPAAIGAACAVASAMNGGRFRVLQWDRRERQYYVIQIDTNGRTQQ